MTLRRFHSLLGTAASDASSVSDRGTKGQRSGKSRRTRSDRRSKWQTADRRLNHETLEKRELLAAEVVAIRPDAGALISDGDTLRNTPREINLLFNGNANLVENTINGNVRLVRAGGDGTFGDGNEVEVSLGYLGLETPGDTSLEGRQRIVMRPASNAIHNATDPSASLPDDTYRIEITASLQSEEAGGNVAFNDGADFASTFTLDRAAQVTAVVPQPVQRTNTTPLNPRGTLTQQSNIIEVHFDNQTLDINDAQDVTLYRLVNMDDTVATPIQPQSAVYDVAANMVTLTFADDLPEANFRLDLGEEFVPQGPMIVGNGSDDSNSSIDAVGEEATNLGVLTPDGIRVTSRLTSQDTPLPPYVGSQDEPGHRQIQREAHIGATGTDLTVPQNIRNVGYHFPLTLGTDSNGNTYPNLITDAQKEIVRKILDVYAAVSGYEFVEVEEENPGSGLLMIGNGDFRAVSPGLGPNDGVAGLANSSFAMVNGAIYNQATNFYGDGFTNVMMHEIGHSLGLGHSYEIPSVMGGNLPNDVLPGDHDVVHLQRITPPNNTDIDMYGFQLPESGRFSAETFAQRLTLPSSLSTVLTLYRQDGSSLELIAQNDRYFGDDSYLNLELEAGNYFLGVTSTGNDDYDPRIAETGYGGTTGGIGTINSAYELELSFKAASIRSMRDASGTPIDGDRDGNAGGVYSFYFQTSDPDASLNTTIFVDRLNDPTVNVIDGSGSITDPFDTISAALEKAGNRLVVPLDIAQLDASDQFSVSVTVAGNPNEATFLFDGVSIPSAATNANDLAIDIANAINARFAPGTATANGRTVDLTGIDTLDISQSDTLMQTPNIVRIIGNDLDGDPSTTNDLVPYLIGTKLDGSDLRDGGEFRVPQGATAMVDAGVLFKMRRSNLDAGSSSIDVNRAGGALQILGTPDAPVWMRSLFDNSFGGNSGSIGQVAGPGDFGGIVLRDDSDLEDFGIFLSYVSHTDIRHGGGKVFVDSSEESFTPIHLSDARPAIAFNTITDSQGVGAISASPDSFDDRGGRIGPEVVGNFLRNNSRNGLFVRIETDSNAEPTKLNVPGRFNDTDIPHLISENLIIAGNPGGRYVDEFGDLHARASGRLMIDPGIVLKLDGVRIEAETGGSTLIAEGTENSPVIFTSLNDDRYGGSGVFDTTNTPETVGAPGDWGGIYFGFTSQGSIDNAIVTFGGGQESTTPQGSDGFNAIEIHQADVRIANSLITNNADGNASGTRAGRGANQAAAIYVRGAQPIIVNNRFVDNEAAAININANSLKSEINVDPGRMTGFADRFDEFNDNVGPLIRLNQMDNNAINGMLVRGEVLTTESIWDDTDIVHVLTSEVTVGNHHSYSGLTLKSSGSESLVVKLSGANAGFTATGNGLDIVDRIGGTVTVLGAPGFPVVLTSLQDDSVGAGFAPDGSFVVDTNNDGLSIGLPGQWRGLQFDEFSNDRNVGFALERETPLTSGKDINRTNASAQFLGALAADYKSGDENKRLGFEVQGFISPDDPTDVDVYSFEGVAGTEVWIDIDRTDHNLDAVIELLDASGNVVARSANGFDLNDPDNLLPNSLSAGSLTQNDLRGGDFYSQNFRDPGMSLRLPGSNGETGRYFLRIRSRPSIAIGYLSGESRGRYQLQVRLQQEDEFPGSTVRYSDIRFATTAIDVQGLPNRSLLTGEVGEVVGGGNDTFDTAQPLVNLLESDRALLSIAGVLGNEGNQNRDVDVDWYAIDTDTVGVQVIPGVNDGSGTVAVVFDMDYADKANRADTTVAVFDGSGQLIFVGRESNIEDDQPAPGEGADVDDLSRGSLGDKDPYIGPVHITPGDTYYVAVMGNGVTPNALMQFYQDTAGGDDTYADNDNRFLRLEPVNSVQRVVEDHLGFTGYDSDGADIQPTTSAIFDLADPSSHLPGLPLAEVPVFIASDRPIANADDQLYLTSIFADGPYDFAVSPNNWQANNDDIQDIVIRSDGRMFGYLRVTGDNANVGQLVEIDPASGTVTPVRLDAIPGTGTTPNTRNLPQQIASQNGVFDERADEFTNSDEVDALTVQRTGSASATPTYDYYYSVRESDGSSKLYRANGDGNATPTPANGGNVNNPSSVKYGLMGNINVQGTRLLDLGGGNVIKIFALNGDDFSVQFIRTADPTSVVSVNVGARTATVNIDRLNAPTTQAIVDLINNDPQLRQIAFAQIETGIPSSTGTNDFLIPSAENNSQSAVDAGRLLFDDGTNQTSVILASTNSLDFNISVTRTTGPTAITSSNGFTRNATINLSTSTPASAQDLVDLINNDATVSSFVTARFEFGPANNVGQADSPANDTHVVNGPTYVFDDGSNLSSVLLRSTTTADFTISVTRNIGPTDFTTIDATARTATINLSTGTPPTAQEFIDLVNSNTTIVSSYLEAVLVSGPGNNNGLNLSPDPGTYNHTPQTITFDNGTDTTELLLTSVTGESFTVSVNRSSAATAVTSVDVASRTASINISTTSLPSAGAVESLINGNADLSTFVTASILSGVAGNAGSAASPATGVLSHSPQIVSFDDGVDTTEVLLESVSGEDYTVSLTRDTGTTAVVAFDTVARTTTINLDPDTPPTAADLIALINNDTDISGFVNGRLFSGPDTNNGVNQSPKASTQVAAPETIVFDNGTDISTILLSPDVVSPFTINVVRSNSPTGFTFIDSASGIATLNLSIATLPTAQQVIDLINNNPVVGSRVSATLDSGPGNNEGVAGSPLAGTIQDTESAHRVRFSNGFTSAEVVLYSRDGASFDFSLTRNQSSNSIIANSVSRTITVNLDSDLRPTPQQLVNLIQGNPTASSFLSAFVDGPSNLTSDIVGTPAPQSLSVDPLTYAYTTLVVENNATPQASTTIRIKSTLPGVDGDFTVNVTRPGNNTAANVQLVSLTNRTINLQIGSQNGGGPTAAAIVDAINNDAEARQLVTAVIVEGNANGNRDGNDGTTANQLTEGVYVAARSDGLEGVVSGLAFNDPVSPTAMFGVTTAGEFLEINPGTGRATLLWKDLGYDFTALTLGPQNAEGGRYRDVFFATTEDKRVVAFEFDASLGTWELAPVFDGVGASAFETQLSDIAPSSSDAPVGLAFSPLDINLWHPTTRRATEVGHGINEAPDGSRRPSDVTVTYPDVNPNGGGRVFNQAEGGASFYFGLEDWITAGSFGDKTEGYFTYNGVNAQYGLSENLHRDLISNTASINTYALAGGAQGSLISNDFSLSGSVAEDRPTLYVNYFLESENHPGQHYADTSDPFRDSARILASTDGGLTWNLLATNNSQLSAADPQASNQAELPGFISHLADAGSNSGGPRPTDEQVVQELFDNTGSWRQVRVDLSDYAGQDVRLRFDFSTAGRIAGDGIDDAIGDLSDEDESIRTQNNLFEGFYIDDIIVGYAERGEMATVPEQVLDEATPNLNDTRDISADSGTFELLNSTRFSNRDPDRNPDVYNGAYQLEVRRTDEYASLTPDGISVFAIYDTNDRHVIDVSETAVETFESGSFAITPANLSLNGLDINASELTSFEATSVDPYTGQRSLQSGDTNSTDYSYWQTSVSSLGSPSTEPGIIEFAIRVSSAEHLHGLRFYINGTPQVLSTAHGEETPTLDDLQLASGEYFYRKLRFPFAGGDSVFTWLYDQTATGLTGGENTAFIDDVRLLQGGTGSLADENVQRQQGLFIIDSNTISGSSDFGISVGPGVAAQTGVAEPGSVINFPQQNTDRLVPGVVIVNNVIAGESAIEFAGEANALPNRPVPFGRITNNTLVGDGNGVGVDVVGLAAPTLLNNIFYNFANAIDVEGFNAGNTVTRSNYFQANVSNGAVGSDATVQNDANTPLFVDPVSGNYYLVDGAGPLDNALELLPDRLNYVSFKNELGISISNIVAPDRDVYGQLRADSGQSGGGGAQVFIDQGAIDRADGDQPYAVLRQPIDNDNAGNDLDPNQTVVQVNDPILDAFSILIGDGRGENAPFEGTGINPATINNVTVTLRRNNVELVEGVDFVLGFNASTGELRLVPLSTLWQPSSVYEISLDNQTIADRAGNKLRPNRANGTTAFTIILPTVQMDFGDAPDSYGTYLANDGARHAIINDGVVRFGSLIDNELDSEGFYGRSDDDTPSLVLNPAAGLLGTVFDIPSTSPGQISLSVNTLPTPGDTLEIVELQGDQVQFEFILAGTAPSEGNIGVIFDPAGSTDEFAQALETAIGRVFVDFGGDISIQLELSDPVAGTPSTLTLTKFDDEDGIGIGRLQSAGDPAATPALPAVDYRVFYDPDVTPENFTDPNLVLGYLNPQDPRGTTLVLNASTDAFVDAWIDFNGNTVFDPDTETILDSVPVVAGRNEFTIQTPTNTSSKLTWARFRLSPEGNATPTGLVIGGEVEDYQVSIVNVALPEPVNDNYVVDEDEVLDSSTLGSNQSVFGNDSFDAAQFMPVTAVVVDEPAYGTLTFDSITGEFTYDSFEDFAGIDTFTYRLYDQATGAAGPVNDVMGNPIGYGTVTINVAPVNDVPSVENLTLLALEDTERTFTAEQLKASAFGDGNREFVLTLPDGSTQSAPWDESIQSFDVVALHTTVGGLTTDITSATTVPVDGFKTPRGRIIPIWDGTVLDEIRYLADTDLNQDNPNGDSLLRDEFQFTIEDDGVLVNPGADLVNSSDDTSFIGGKLTAQATAQIDVKPKNDAPIASEDLISENNADWNAFFIGPDPMNPVASVPVPTEDQTLVIPQAYLIANDKEARDSATDENDNTNDAGLTVTAVSATSALGGMVSIDIDGNIVYTPALNTYGEDSFTYTVTDAGITFDLGTEAAPGSMLEEDDFLTHTATVRILIKPVNDTPQADDLALDLLEYQEDEEGTGEANPVSKSDGSGFKDFSKNDLLRLGGAGSALEVTPPADFPADFDEDAQDLRVIKIGLPDATAASVDARLLTYDAVTGLAPVQTLATARGTLSLTFSLVPDPANPGSFLADSGEFVSGSYEPNVDYNEESPFDATDLFTYFVEDFSEIPVPGAGNFPGESPESDGHGSLTSAAATVTVTTHATNDTPEFPVFDTVTFAEDINDAGDAFNTVFYDIYGEAVIASADPAVHNLPQAIFVSRATAEDERGNDSGAVATQSLSYTYSTLYEPAGMFESAPVLDEYGVLTLTPRADAYGYALYEVTMTDNGQSYDPNTGMLVDDFRSVTRTLTVHITPVNDAPVTEDRALEVMEVEEFSSPDDMPTGAVASIDLTPDQFLGGTTENPELAEQSDFTDDIDAVDEFDEEEQSLRVVKFTVTLANGSTVDVDTENNNGVELTLATGRITFNFDDIADGGAYTGGVYYPNVDYNEETPFAPNEQFTYVVEDFGVTTIPGSLDVTGTTEQVDYTDDGATPPVGLNNRSTPRTMTLTTRAQNDVPEFPVFGEVTFAEDINDAGDAFNTVFYDIYGEAVIASADPAVHNLPQAIHVSRVTAEDERGNDSGALPTQSLSFSFTTLYEPAGMFETTPTLDEYGVLTLTPRADAYGYAVFVVTLTDDGGSYNLPNDPRSIDRTLTVHITPVNDAPVTVDRALEVDEVEEFASPDDSPTGDVASIDLTPEQFLGGSTENPEFAEQSDFTDDIDAVDEFDEEEQSLRVVEFTVTLADGSTAIVDAENNNGVELTLATGRITFNFDDIADGGAYTGGVYYPNVDYNEESPFAPNEQFTYVVEDFGTTSIPGSQFINGGAADEVDYTNDGAMPPVGLNNRSTPRTMTLTTRAQNDAPEFPVFNTVTFAEDINDAGDTFNTVIYDIYGESIIASADPAVHNLPQAIFVSRETAEDERGNAGGAPATQSLTYTYNPLYVPAGMFESDPVLDEYGVLTLTPRADAYGYAVYTVTMTDDGQSYDPNTGMLVDDFRSITRTLTVHITPVNDAPVTVDRALEAVEAEEFANETGLPTGDVASINLTPEQFLGGSAENSELAEQSDFTDDLDAVDEFDEEEQSLRVVEFTVTLADGSTVVVDAENNNGVELTLATGRVTFNFDDISIGGAYTGGVYYPNVDYNEEAPFAANEQFTYVVEDFGTTSIPGSQFVNSGAADEVDYTNDGAMPPVGLNNRSTPRTMTLTTRAKNDAPEFPVFDTVTFAEDINDTGDSFNTVFYDVYAGNVVANYDPADPMRPQAIFVSRDTAFDERGDGLGFDPTQSLSYTFTSLASSSPAGMFETLPTMDDFGVLTLTPRADVYGWAVFEVTATDDGSDYDAAAGLISSPRSITRTLTINITPVNDAPVSVDRDLEVTEVEEFSSPNDLPTGAVARLPLSPADFLGGTPENPTLAKASDFSDDTVTFEEFDEDEQGLRVVEFTVTLANGSPQTVNAGNYVNGTPIDLFSGTIWFEFDATTGEFVTGEYLPNVDVNDQLPFEPTEVFQYIVEDFGPTSIPGSDRPEPDAIGSIDYTTVGGVGSNNRSQPRDMTLTVRAVNDVPDFPEFDTVTFAEDINDAGGAFNTVFYDIYGGQVIGSNNPLVHGLPQAIHPGRDTALDERSVQELSYSVSVISSPAGMFASDPILDRFGVLQLQPNADAYGYAVFALTMTDDGQSYISGSMQDDPRSITRTLTVNITPVNDQPVAYDRELTVNEVEEFFPITGQPTGRVAVLDLTPETFLEGNPSDAQTADFADGVVTTNEFDEDEQDLRVVQFTVTNSSGTPTVVSRDNLNGVEIPLATGTVTFNFDASGAFVSGQYLPSVDYNQEDPFLDFERFSYIVEDFGETSIPGSDYVNGQMAPPVAGFQQADYTTVGGVGSNNRSESRRVTIRTIQVNDAPRVEFRETVDIRERDDNRGTSLTDWATRRDPAETTALDEFDRQDVFFTFKQYVSQSVPDLFRPGFTPEVSDDGTLTVYPSPDAVGTGVFVITATDRVSDTDPFTPKSTEMTVTVNVRPVNDQPRLSDIAPTGQTGSIDDAYEITSDGTLIVTMKEDNTANDGTTGTPYSIPLRSAGPGARPGLLDIYTPGPANESDGTLGGNQKVELVPFTTLPTTLGGSVTYVPENGSTPASLEYTPPTNVNSLNNLPDSFTYQVIDDGTNFNIRDQVLDTSPLTRTGRIQFVLNPVNDRPVFDIAQTVINVSEDANMFVRNDFAFNVFGGPTPTANDEFSLTAAQTVSFNRIEPVNVSTTQAAQAFTTLPTIVPAGHLTFQAAPGVFGEFVFDIYGQDNGQGPNFGRGDLNESLAQRITINVLAVNDAPIPANGTGDTVTIATREDNTLAIPVDGVINGSLLGNFIAGPDSPVDGLPDENESQTLSAVNVPLQTAMGGTLTPSPNGAGATSYVYTPPLNFVGTDQFVYEVSDGDASRTTSATISLVVTPVNDAPIISPLAPIVVEESAGTVTLPDWLGTVLVGPPGTGSGGRAVDEFDGTGTTAPQTITEYRFSYVSGDTDLLATSAGNPAGLQILSDGSLQFTTSDENSGSATYQLVAVDSGPNNPANGDVWESAPVQFTLTIADVNDLPTFTAGPAVTVLEDSGTYSQPWATDISAGPGNEGNQTVAFLVQVPAEDQDLFSVLPSIDENGVLTFSVAPDAAGSTDVTVTLQDFENGVFAGSSQPVTLSITITDQPDLPVAVDDSFTTTEDAVLFFTIEDLLANDSDPDLSDILSFVELQTTTALGAIVNVNQTTGEISYTPMGSDTIQSLRPGETATDTFQYGLQDDSGVTSVVTANVTLTIQGRNDAPVAVDDRVFIESVGTTVLDQMRDPLFNDSDIDGTLDRTSLTIVVEPQFGTLSDDNGVLTYLPGPDFAGVDTFTYTIADDLGQASAQATVELQGRPTASDITAGTSVGRTGAIDISDSFNTAFDLDLTSILITTQPTNGTAEVIDGKIMYTPDTDYVGPDFLIFTVADINGNRSAPTRMNLNTVMSRLQNPVNFSDVNRNGEVTALDALLIINRLNEVSGSSSGENIPVTDADFGIGTNNGVNEQFYYDQSGDGFISSLDALRVINEINAQSQSGFGEPTDVLASDFSTSAGLDASTSSAAESVDSGPSKMVGSSATNAEVDLIDLIANEQTKRDGEESDSLESNLDAAVRELF